MLDELFKLVTSESQEQIINNPQVPNEQNEAAIQTTTDSIFQSLQGQVNQGNGADVLSLLGGQSNMQGNPLMGNLTSNVTNSLMDKLGVDSPVAKQIAAALVPIVISKLVNRTNDPNDNGFDLNSIFGSLTNGKSNGMDMGSLLGQLSGGQQNNLGQNNQGQNNQGQNNQEQGGDLSSIFNMLSGK